MLNVNQRFLFNLKDLRGLDKLFIYELHSLCKYSRQIEFCMNFVEELVFQILKILKTFSFSKALRKKKNKIETRASFLSHDQAELDVLDLGDNPSKGLVISEEDIGIEMDEPFSISLI